MRWSKITDQTVIKKGTVWRASHIMPSSADWTEDQNNPIQTLGNPKLDQRRFRFIEYCNWFRRNGGLRLCGRNFTERFCKMFYCMAVSCFKRTVCEAILNLTLCQYINSITSDYVAFDASYWLSFMLRNPVRFWSSLLYVSEQLL